MTPPFLLPGAQPPIRTFPIQFQSPEALAHVDKPLGQDVSALAISGKTLFCACDETSTIECLTFDDAKTGFSNHRNISLGEIFDLPGGPDGEMDIEGIAIAGNRLWISGSHALKRRRLKDNGELERLHKTNWDSNRGFVGYLPLIDRGKGVVEIDPHSSDKAMMRMGRKGRKGLLSLIKHEPLLGPALLVPAKENGFDIEGLAFVKDRLILGLRGPVIGKTALLVSIDLQPSSGGWLEPADPYRLHFLPLEGFGIRDLLVDGDRLLVLTGPTQAIEGPQRIYAIEGFDPAETLIPPERVRDVLTLPMQRGCDHAEGIAHFQFGGEDLLLVVYDSPSPDRYSEDRHELLLDVFPFPPR